MSRSSKNKSKKKILWLFDRKGATSKEQHWIHCLPLPGFAALALGCVHATCCCRSVPNTSFAWASESYCVKRQRSRLDSNRQKDRLKRAPHLTFIDTPCDTIYIYIYILCTNESICTCIYLLGGCVCFCNG